MKRILLTSIIILISLIGYSQEKTDFIKVDPLTLGIQTTTVTVKTRDEIESKIDEYNRRMESLFMEREEWVKLLDQCDKLNIVLPQDTVGQQVTEESSSGLGTGKMMIKNTGKTTAKRLDIIVNGSAVGGPDKPDVKVSGETKKAKKKK